MLLPRQVFGMRWWLGLAFAGVAALTAVAVVGVLNRRSVHAFRQHAEEFAVGNSVAASETLKHAATPEAVRAAARSIALHRHLAVWAFDAHGRFLSDTVTDGYRWSDVPGGEKAREMALGSNRYIEASREGSVIVVALPVHQGAARAVVVYARRHSLRDSLGIVRNESVPAALIAFAVGAALGLVIATLTARRLRRIAVAARSIGAGDFGTKVSSRFPDEVGSLALSLEGMRDQLEELFAALERDRDRLEHVFDRLDDGVLVVTRDLRIEFANDRARELLGVGDRVEAPGIRRLAADLFSTELPGRLRLTADGRVLEVSGIPPVEGGESAIVVVHDESQKERNERVQREFATNAAHELRTPLASIVTAVEMLQTGAKDDPGARDEFLEVIARESGRLARLTRALLVLARADAGDEAPRRNQVPIEALLEQVAGSLAPRPGVRVAVECDPGLAIEGDADLLEQALSSIGTNAVQHTDAGSVTLRGRAENGSAVIEVADTGRGIDPRERGRIFDRFYRAADGKDGFGLGLSIAREAVGALGGEIELESEVGAGTTVRITLDRAGAAPPAEDAEDGAAVQPAGASA